MRISIILCFLCCTLILGCNDDGEPNPATLDEAELGIITGLYLTNDVASAVGKAGNPNEKASYTKAFPNPAYHYVNIRTEGNIETLWVLPAEVVKKYSRTNFPDLLEDQQYSESEIAKSSIQETEVNNSRHTVEFDNIGPGYYRIFVLLEDGTLDWKNVCILDVNDNKAYDRFEEEWF